MLSVFGFYLLAELIATPATPLKAEDAEICYAMIDMLFLVDDSGSVCNIKAGEKVSGCDNWRHTLEFVKAFVEGYEIDSYATNVALAKFNSFVSIRWNFDGFQEKELLLKYILRIPYGNGGTNTGKALKTVRERILNSDADREDAPNIIIIITDGDAEDLELVEKEIKMLAKDDVKVFAVGIGEVSTDMLAKTSSQPQMEGKTWFRSASFSNLGQILRSVQQGIQCDATWWSHFYERYKYLIWLLGFLLVTLIISSVILIQQQMAGDDDDDDDE